MIGRGDPNNCEACVSRSDGGLCYDHLARFAEQAEAVAHLLNDLDAGTPIAPPKHVERVA